METMPMSDSEGVFGDDPKVDKFVEAYEAHRAEIYDGIYDYMVEAEISEAYVAQLLIDVMIRMRMSAYGFGVESPSVSGLKLDLDRLRAEVGEFLREAKKGAEDFIAQVKDARAEADAEEAEETGDK
jgi:hypothetical protein